MGCDIHLITQVRQNGIWNTVEEIPEEFCERNYSTFSVLADVRNNWDRDGFQPKGLPEDLSPRKYRFRSEKESIIKRYNENSDDVVELPDGSYIKYNDKSMERQVFSKEEFESFPFKYSCSTGGYTYYYVYDESLVNGIRKKVPLKELMSFEEFLCTYEDEWDDDAQDYGYWRVDFDCCDYHSHSYLSLRELLEFDRSDYDTTKVKVSRFFYDKFIEMGGVMPEAMKVNVEPIPGDICDALRYAYCPEVIVSIPSSQKEIDEAPLTIGINQLKEIAAKYNVEADDIRIVFAFDN